MVARDQENDELKYGISGSYAYFFSVTSNTGEVKLASLLDYEVKKATWEGLVRGGEWGGPWWTPEQGSPWSLSLCPLQTLDWFTINIFVSDSYDNRVSQQGERRVMVPGSENRGPRGGS